MNTEDIENKEVQEKTEDIFAQRVAKSEALAAEGVNPFGERFDDACLIEKIKLSHKPECDSEQPGRAAGRITAFRLMGKSIFADIRDSSGKIQLYIQKDHLGEESFGLFKRLDIGDIIGVDGALFITKMGELTLKVHSYKLLSKSLRPLPEKWHGLTDIEQRYRQRYLDLIVNEKSRDVFKNRFAIIREIRRFLETKGFTEVETPMLQPIPGGASANPFKTFYEALNHTMYMRIAPELYLKRLLVGGFEKVFELNRNFRNEGMSRRHNPEFTMMEIYQAYGDCRTMMDLVEELITTIAMNVFGTLKIEHGEGKTIDLTRPWRRAPYKELVMEKMGADWFDISFSDRVKRAREAKLDVNDKMPDYEVTNEVYEKLIENTLVQPAFVTRLPAQLVPLAKKCADDPTLVDVFELEINGQEIAPGYSELNDPIEQRRRFQEQLQIHGEEDAAAHKVDEDFLTSLEYGMPPAGGMGIGIDRLVMLLTGAESIRDVILFPQLRPKAASQPAPVQ
ncbi:MAG: lysine--tRNA ligase [Lentisphaerae bacterium GWF2_45_14]|nr:MAG: lysine--tRNA ligase [Lentisphaerae bacterium GWF2_45_14]